MTPSAGGRERPLNHTSELPITRPTCGARVYVEAFFAPAKKKKAERRKRFRVEEWRSYFIARSVGGGVKTREKGERQRRSGEKRRKKAPGLRPNFGDRAEDVERGGGEGGGGRISPIPTVAIISRIKNSPYGNDRGRDRGRGVKHVTLRVSVETTIKLLARVYRLLRVRYPRRRGRLRQRSRPRKLLSPRRSPLEEELNSETERRTAAFLSRVIQAATYIYGL